MAYLTVSWFGVFRLFLVIFKLKIFLELTFGVTFPLPGITAFLEILKFNSTTEVPTSVGGHKEKQST
jgi:uncharacterized membrane protein